MTVHQLSTQQSEPFELFWECYPRKTAKKAARKAWPKALRAAPLERIMAGLNRYIRCKPDYQDWMHPATFLNGERWEDEYEGGFNWDTWKASRENN